MSLQKLSIAFGQKEELATPLSQTRIETLVKSINEGLTKDNNNNTLLSGYISPEDNQITEGNEYIIRTAGVGVIGNIIQETYEMNLVYDVMYEGGENMLSFINKKTQRPAPISSMHIEFNHSIIRNNLEITEEDIKSSISMNSNGVITVEKPTKNVTWTDVITITAYPATLDGPDYTDDDRAARTLSKTLTVQAIAVTGIEVSGNSKFYKEGEGGHTFNVKLMPPTNTKTSYATPTSIIWRASYGLFSNGTYTAPTNKGTDNIYCDVTFMGSLITNNLNPLSIIIETTILSETINPLVWNAVKSALSLDNSVTSWTTSDAAAVTNSQFDLILSKLYLINEPHSFDVGEYFTGVTSITTTATKRFSKKLTSITMTKLEAIYSNGGVTSANHINYLLGNPTNNESAFSNCTILTSVNLPALTILQANNSLTETSFAQCTSLEEINLPSLTTLNASWSSYSAGGPCTFYGCSKLKKVSLPEYTGFYKNTNSNNVIKLFQGCTALKELYMPKFEMLRVLSGPANIYVWMFQGCTSLEVLSLPSCHTIEYDSSSGGSVTEVFQGLTALKELYLPKLQKLTKNSRINTPISFTGLTSLNKLILSTEVTGYLELTGHDTFKGDGQLNADTNTLDFSDIRLRSILADAPGDKTKNVFSDTSIVKVVLPSTFYSCGSSASNTESVLSGSMVQLIDCRLATYVNNFGGMLEDVDDTLRYIHIGNLLPPAIDSIIGKCPIFVPASTFTRYQAATVWKDYYNAEGYAVLRSIYNGNKSDISKNIWVRGGDTSYAEATPGTLYKWSDGTWRPTLETFGDVLTIGNEEGKGIYNGNTMSIEGLANLDNGGNIKLYGGKIGDKEDSKLFIDIKVEFEYITSNRCKVKTLDGRYWGGSKTLNSMDSYWSNTPILLIDPSDTEVGISKYIYDFNIVTWEGKKVLTVTPGNLVGRWAIILRDGIPWVNGNGYTYGGTGDYNTYYNDGILFTLTPTTNSGSEIVTVTEAQVNNSKVNKNRLFPDDMLPWFIQKVFGITQKDWDGDMDDVPGSTLISLPAPPTE